MEDDDRVLFCFRVSEEFRMRVKIAALLSGETATAWLIRNIERCLEDQGDVQASGSDERE